MTEADDFAVLMGRVNAGSDGAARELFERYGPHIRRVVRRQLDRKLRTQFDSTDFVQDVWTSFFADRRRSRRRFEQPEALVAFLANMAYHKVVDAFRRRVQTRKRDANRERSLESKSVGGSRLAGRQPTPSQLVIAEEHWQRMLEGQPEHYREILTLLRQGHSHVEIARRLGVNEKTVRRLLQRVNPPGE